MTRTHRWFAFLALAVVGSAAAWSARQQPDAEPRSAPPAAPTNIVRQGFPAQGSDPTRLEASDSAWVVQWEITNPTNGGMGRSAPPSSVLKINSAKFMYKDKSGQPRWITVLRNLEVGETFVPYDPGFPRYRDVTMFSFYILPADRKLLGPSCVAPGEILTSANPLMNNKVYKEVHDDGLRWLADGNGRTADAGRRGEKMQLWAVFYGANYRYIFEYTFYDEGSIGCRMGATARNLLPRQPDNGDVHLHVGCWMFEPDLGDPNNPANGGPNSNVVRLVRRVPQTYGIPDGKYRVDVRPYGTPTGTPLSNPAFEGSADWTAEEFTALRVESTVRKNNHPNPLATGYDLIPIRFGSVRNFPPEFEWVNRDFWVTGEQPAAPRYMDVAKYVQNPPRAIDKKPVTVWHNSPMYHVPRAEDLAPNGRDNYPHVALTAWSGFLLKPRNLFDSTPLFTPPAMTEDN